MTTHELAKLLLEEPDAELVISVDVSTCCADSGHRVFVDPIDRCEIIHHEDFPGGKVFEVVMCVDGKPNFEYAEKYESEPCGCVDCKKRVAKDKATLKRLKESGVW